MKKLTYFLTVFVMFLTACSSDGDSSSDSQLSSEGTLIKKSITHYSGNTEVVTDFHYNGNKILKSTSSNGRRYDFLYTGNLITEVLFFENNVLKEKDKIQYSSEGKITEKLRMIMSDNKAYRNEYTYNPERTITIKGYSGDFNNQNVLYNDRKVYLDSDGDVKKTEKYFLANGQNHTETTVFTYDADDKKNLNSVVVGHRALKYWEYGSASDSFKNLLNSTMTSTQNSYISTVNISCIYNSYNHPKKVSMEGFMTTEYFY